MVLKSALKTSLYLTLSLSCRAWADCRPSETDTSFMCVKFLRAHDGDTISVNIAGTHPLFGKNISIRVRGIDTPEMNSAIKCQKVKAMAAKVGLEAIVNGAKQIDLVNVGRDKYFRILATVRVDGKDLGQLLLAQKLAQPYDGGTKTAWTCKN